MDRPLHILFTTSWYPTRMHPTLGNFVARHAEAVSRLHHVQVLCLAYDPDHHGEPAIEEMQRGQLCETRIYYGKGFHRLWSRWRAFRTGVEHILSGRQAPFDLVHHHVAWPEAWQARILGSRWHVPVVLTEHWTGYLADQRGPLPAHVRRWVRWMTSSVSVSCPVTHHLGRHMQSAGIKGRYIPVSNVVDTDLFVPGAREGARFRMIHVSSLSDAHKNVRGLLRALRTALDSRSDLHLDIGGDGDPEPFAEYARELGIPDDAVSFFGIQPPSAIAERMGRSHALVLFSRYENFPCVIPEALSCGLRIISSDVGGIAEHVDGSRGTLVPSEDVPALAKAILAEAQDSPHINRDALREYAVVHFSMIAIGRAFHTVYQQALEEVRP